MGLPRNTLKYVPWLTILGLVGAGIGFLVGGGEGSQASYFALMGLCAGVFAGMVVRIMLRKSSEGKEADRYTELLNRIGGSPEGEATDGDKHPKPEPPADKGSPKA